MKTSIITTVTINTPHRKDPWREAIECYLDFADEVVVVCGHEDDMQTIEKQFPEQVSDTKLKLAFVKWPYKWEWSQLPKAMNKALDLAAGDIIMRNDIDYFIHENNFKEFKEQLEEFYGTNSPVGRTLKVNIYNKNQGLIKSRNPNLINGNWKKKIRFGKALNKETDWTAPTFNYGTCKNPSYNVFEEDDMPLCKTWIYNYDYFFCTKEDAKEEFWRFAQAYAARDDLSDKERLSWGKTKEEAYRTWYNMVSGRLGRAGEQIESHPKWIAKKIDQMTEDMWGYNNFGLT